MVCIAIYNSFWRYIGNERNKGKLSSKEVIKIGKERDYIAKIYPKVEKIINECLKYIGEKNKFDGDLLRYNTLNEMKDYLKDMKINDKMIQELNNRKKGYFYMYIEKPFSETILTDKKLIEKIKDEFFNFKGNVESLKGHSIYGGIVQGVVYNLKNHSREETKKLDKNYIIVATMTKPDDIDIIKKSKAIITDEGGILSHASITARELKIPCIIGTKIATQVLHDGDLVEVDADKGIVKIIKRA
jgi:phosphoenolpyruvate synthase/pyruvate phosphate dikinase